MSNARLAQFFSSHDHYTKLTSEELEYVEGLLFGTTTSPDPIITSTPFTATPALQRTSASKFSLSSLTKQQPPALIVPSSAQKKKLLFIPVQEQLPPAIPELEQQPIEQQQQQQPTESRPMTSAAKHLMESLLSMNENSQEETVSSESQKHYEEHLERGTKEKSMMQVEAEVIPEPVNPMVNPQSLPQTTQPAAQALALTTVPFAQSTAPIIQPATQSIAPAFTFSLPAQPQPSIAPPSLPKFHFDLTDYQPKVTGISNLSNNNDNNLPKFNFNI